tara:strand:- start:195 stop:485 length:291 start_codon:yes stop_codon:yes gene_type:complete
MTLKNTIQFKNYKVAMSCAKVMHRLPKKWNAEIQAHIDIIINKINNKIYTDDGGTINIRLTKELTEFCGECLASHISSVEDMYKKKYSEAFKKLFK